MFNAINLFKYSSNISNLISMSYRPDRKSFFHCQASPAWEAPKNIYSLISLRGIPGSFAPAAACRFSHNESGIFCGCPYTLRTC